MYSLCYYGYYARIRKQFGYELQKLWTSATLNYCDLCALTRGFVCANCTIVNIFRCKRHLSSSSSTK